MPLKHSGIIKLILRWGDLKVLGASRKKGGYGGGRLDPQSRVC